MMRSENGLEQRLCQNFNHNTVLMLALKHLFKVDTDISHFIDSGGNVLLLPNRQLRIPLHLLFMNNAINLELEHVEMLSQVQLPGGSMKRDAILLHKAQRGSMALHTAISVADAALGSNRREGVERLREMLPQIVPLLTDSNGNVFEARYESIVRCARDNIDREISDTPLHLALKTRMPWNVVSLLLGTGKKMLKGKLESRPTVTRLSLGCFILVRSLI